MLTGSEPGNEMDPEPKGKSFSVDHKFYKPLSRTENTITFTVEIEAYELILDLYVKGPAPFKTFMLLNSDGKELCNVDRRLTEEYMSFCWPPRKRDLYEKMIGRSSDPAPDEKCICFCPLVIVGTQSRLHVLRNILPDENVDYFFSDMHDVHVDKTQTCLKAWSEYCKKFTATVVFHSLLKDSDEYQLIVKLAIEHDGSDQNKGSE